MKVQFETAVPRRNIVRVDSEVTQKTATGHSCEPLAFIVKRQTDDRMTKKFLLHKDNKENATAQMAHLDFSDSCANAQKTKRASFLQRSDRRTARN